MLDDYINQLHYVQELKNSIRVYGNRCFGLQNALENERTERQKLQSRLDNASAKLDESAKVIIKVTTESAAHKTNIDQMLDAMTNLYTGVHSAN